ncbi:hypothetical protein ACS0Y7_30765 [Burkholderia gladioli]|uniref:hypothetical protein n=1 Tax=Burkholderia gladioli TaxID=28095 RepID=UPI003F7A55E9
METNLTFDGASDAATQMLRLLLQTASLQRISDKDAYISSLEEIVFELVACRVDRVDRAAARTLYRRGIAVGFHAVAEPAMTTLASHSDDEISPLLKSIRLVGERHGCVMRQEMDRVLS